MSVACGKQKAPKAIAQEFLSNEKAWRRKMTPAGLEPAIPGSVGRCLIHWATGPLILWSEGIIHETEIIKLYCFWFFDTVTVAILAQGTSWAVADMQAFSYTSSGCKSDSN